MYSYRVIAAFSSDIAYIQSSGRRAALIVEHLPKVTRYPLLVHASVRASPL